MSKNSNQITHITFPILFTQIRFHQTLILGFWWARTGQTPTIMYRISHFCALLLAVNGFFSSSLFRLVV
uniref:Ovule protein n=1 Tax=Caenorhabditis tropicalis TaxID=1561998 RepID=A0A1I7T765_9PELO